MKINKEREQISLCISISMDQHTHTEGTTIYAFLFHGSNQAASKLIILHGTAPVVFYRTNTQQQTHKDEQFLMRNLKNHLNI